MIRDTKIFFKFTCDSSLVIMNAIDNDDIEISRGTKCNDFI